MRDDRARALISKSAQERYEAAITFYDDIKAAEECIPQLVRAATGTGRAADQAAQVLRMLAAEIADTANAVLEEVSRRRTKKGLGLVIYLACQPAQRPHWPDALQVALDAWRDLLQHEWKHPYKQVTPQGFAGIAMQGLGAWKDLTVDEAHEIVAFLRAVYALETSDPKTKREQWATVWSLEHHSLRVRNRNHWPLEPTGILEHGLATIDPKRVDEGWWRAARLALPFDAGRALEYAQRAYHDLIPSATKLRWAVPHTLGHALLRNGLPAQAVPMFEEGLREWREHEPFGNWLPDAAGGWLGMIESAAAMRDDKGASRLIFSMAADAPDARGSLILSMAGYFIGAAKRCVDQHVVEPAAVALDEAKSYLDRWVLEHPQASRTKQHDDYEALCSQLSTGEHTP